MAIMVTKKDTQYFEQNFYVGYENDTTGRITITHGPFPTYEECKRVFNFGHIKSYKIFTLESYQPPEQDNETE